MSDLEVQHAALGHASSTIAAIHDELTAAGQQLDRRAQGYLGSGWQGQAAEAFRTGYDEWAAGAREVLAAVMQMSALIDQANQRFARTDQGVDGSMQQLHSRLGGSGGWCRVTTPFVVGLVSRTRSSALLTYLWVSELV